MVVICVYAALSEAFFFFVNVPRPFGVVIIFFIRFFFNGALIFAMCRLRCQASRNVCGLVLS